MVDLIRKGPNLMKKTLFSLILVLVLSAVCFFPVFSADEDEAWKAKPVLTEICELAKGKLLVA